MYDLYSQKLSKGAKWTIFYHITIILQHYWDKTIARSGDMYRDALGTRCPKSKVTIFIFNNF